MSKRAKEKTKQEINAIIAEYFNEDIGGGWSIHAAETRSGGKKVYNISVKFHLWHDREEEQKTTPSFSVFFPTHIVDGTPKKQWETELRELFERISREFTGDVEQTFIKLQEIIQQTYDCATQSRTTEAFLEQVEDLDLWRYKKYVAAVDWDTWEQMQLQQEIQNNQQKQETNNGKKKNDRRTKRN